MMIFKPHDYQMVSKDMIINNRACGLFLECGMGKTASTLCAIDELMFDYFDIKNVLVIAPKKVARDTWKEEVDKWDNFNHLKLSVVIGTPSQRISALKTNADIYCINRENVSWLVDYYQSKWPFDMVVLDELSSFKSPKAHRFKDLRKVMPLTHRVVGLTGTPAPNGLIDLWSQIYLLDRGEHLGKTLKAFHTRYFTPGMCKGFVVYNWNLKSNCEEEIYKAIEDICISMKSVDHIKMPEMIENFISVKIEGEARVKYKQMEKDLLLPYLSGDVVAANSAVLSNKLIQIANGAVYDEDRGVKIIHDEKLKALEELVEEANGKPVIIFYWFRHELERIKSLYPNARSLNTTQDMKDWNDRKIPILLMHPASAGHGLNLQHGGNVAIWFSLTWSLELLQQSNARLYRQGQDKDTVFIHYLVAEHTIDEDVVKALKSKSMSQSALMDAVKARVEDLYN